MRPGQQPTRLILLPASPPHALGDQTAFIFGHRPADLQQQLIMGILAHGMIGKLHLAPGVLELFQQEHLMHIVARQAGRLCQDNPIKGGLPHLLTQVVESGATQVRSTVAVIAKDGLIAPRPSLALTVLL